MDRGGRDISADTKTRLLDAAEELFARNGLGGTSTREITSRAGVNVASINYHFGTRERLIEAVFQRRIEPLNKERLRLLDEAEREFGGEPPLERLVESLVLPALRLSDEAGAEVMGIMGRVHSEPPLFVASLFRELFRQVMGRFMPAFAQCLPHLPWEVLLVRLHFMIGSMAHTMTSRNVLSSYAEMDGRKIDSSMVVRELVHYSSAAMASPLSGTASSGESPPDGENKA